ncbi:MAG: hypothetical protein M1839_002959 [Geoglossum umbratile]|nr:MAG: hypothetical protein M1839_002959 [Geoglossum umbratile]
MIQALRAGEIDVGIGLTEGWVAGLGKKGGDDREFYRLVGTYVETPLCWAISTGTNRTDLTSISDLKGTKMGVSRIGSGSYVMGFVLADEQSWLQAPGELPFSPITLSTFANLRGAVNDHTADFFMWEHFTSKRYHDNGAIKRLGEIYTPWSSWKIVAAPSLLVAGDQRLPALFASLDKGISHFSTHPDEAVSHISTALDYTPADARAWLSTVRFAQGVRGVRSSVVATTMACLQNAGVIAPGAEPAPDEIIGILRGEEP